MDQDDEIETAFSKAVAVKKTDEDPAPKITASGKGYRAEKILSIAFDTGVKVRQDRDLADLLSTLEVDAPIPLEAIHTVGLILEKVYQSTSSSQPPHDKQGNLQTDNKPGTLKTNKPLVTNKPPETES